MKRVVLLILACCLVLVWCVPALASVEAAADGREWITDDGVIDSGAGVNNPGDQDSPLAVYLVDPPDPVGDGEGVQLLSISGGVYPGTISASVYNYFRDLSCNLPHGSRYVFYRADRYNYTLVYSDELAYDGSRFTAPGQVTVINYYTGNDGELSRRTDTGLSLSPGSGMVYTNVDNDMYPKLFEGVTSRDIQAVLFVLVAGALYVFICRMFR